MTKQNDLNKVQLEVTAGDKTFVFNITRGAYNKYINSITAANKVGPSHNFLIMTIAEDNKTDLIQFIADNPGSEVVLAGSLLEDYTPDLDIVVKKRSS
ncbi:putative phage tail assembly chaperone [Gammaproteobacteria bacterium]|nr:putative phage tail assembly chaperone [Gammaproteobacteria bacterium]